MEGSATALVILVEDLSIGECQRQGTQEVQIGKGEWPGMTCTNGHVLPDLSPGFFPVFSGAGKALSRVPAHDCLSLGPIYFGVVLAEPCETKDYVLPIQAAGGKNGMLHMIPIAEDQVDHGADGAYFAGCSVDVVDWNWLGEGLHG
ncbi:hypothetical protein C0989_011632 [Termitomyces sp. Mn162]|nr:hypothetical protein C0989_011632 [Termitomyces sp. Mn162]